KGRKTVTENYHDNRKEESNEPSYTDNTDMERRTFLKQTSKVVGAALVATAASSLSAIPVSALEETAKKANNKPHLLFPVISDVHTMADSDRTINKFTETMTQLN